MQMSHLNLKTASLNKMNSGASSSAASSTSSRAGVARSQTLRDSKFGLNYLFNFILIIKVGEKSK
jgi:hypothetical protein